MALTLASFNRTFGFKIWGIPAGVSTYNPAGDFNHDGYTDVAVGYRFASPLSRYQAGEVFVVLGNRGADVFLSNATIPDTFYIAGASTTNYIGYGANALGDINNDSIDDIGFQGISGQCVVIYGNQTISNIDLASFNFQIGFKINGDIHYGNNFCAAISGIGDINNDNINDIGIGDLNNMPFGTRSTAGAGFGLYGKSGKYSSNVNLNSLNKTTGVAVYGAANNDNAGQLVLPAGDFDKDGIKDFAVTAINHSPLGRQYAGTVYIVSGKAGGIPSNIDFANFTSSQVIGVVYGASPSDALGTSFASLGDVDGDGTDDVGIGSPMASGLGRTNCGIIYVIKGKLGGYNSPIDTASLTPSQGYPIYGPTAYYSLGSQVDSAGDINKDNLKDIMTCFAAGTLSSTYFILSAQGGFPSGVDLANLTSSQGTLVYGAPNQHISQCSMLANAVGDNSPDYLLDFGGTAYILDGSKLSAFNSLPDSATQPAVISSSSSSTGSMLSSLASSTGVSSTASSISTSPSVSSTGSSSTTLFSTSVNSITSNSMGLSSSSTGYANEGYHDSEANYIGTALVSLTTVLLYEILL